MIRAALAGVSEQRRSKDRRIASQLFSIFIHGTLLSYLLLAPRATSLSERPIYDIIIRPNERKIIWYRKVPDIVPTTPIGTGKRPQGWMKSKKTIIVRSPDPSSTKQLVLQQGPKLKLERDIQSPNLIAMAAPPPPPKPVEPKAVKPFVAPAPAPPARAPEPQLAEPELTIAPTTTSSSLASLKLPRAVKPFVAPAAGTGQSKGTASLLVDPDSNAAATGGSGSTPGALPNNLGGGSNLNAAIIGLNPAAGPPPGSLPSGSRSGEFSAAPNVGPAASGEGGNGISLPGVMYKDPRGRETGVRIPALSPNAPATPPQFRTLIYDELVPASIRPTLSAPLRPASRTIPRALEARFQGRLVYAVVIPAPNLPAYTGDWIVWFAEQVQRPGETPLMRAPIPLRKTEPLGIAHVLSTDRSEARIQIAAIIKQDGRFDSMVLLRSPNAQVSQSAIEDLKRWDFRPAMRDGAPIGVEVVIEVPFSVAWLSGAGGTQIAAP